MEPDDGRWLSDRVRVKYFIITVINLIIIIVIANRTDWLESLVVSLTYKSLSVYRMLITVLNVEI